MLKIKTMGFCCIFIIFVLFFIITIGFESIAFIPWLLLFIIVSRILIDFWYRRKSNPNPLFFLKIIIIKKIQIPYQLR